MPLVRDYIAEHERTTNFGGEAVRALDHGDYERSRELLAAMAGELASHWRGEENGLFAIMRHDDLYAEHIAQLVAEHRDLQALLESVDLENHDDRERVRTAIFELREHISKEEDGLFPASLTTLDGEDWDAAIAAWQDAHPGQHLIGRD
ncbi:MAG TPA: hemerythrin domain-containing protein [Mycobacterium sp.]